MREEDYKKKIRQFYRRITMEAGVRAGTIGLATGLFGMAAVLLYGRLYNQTLLWKEAGLVAVVLLLLVSVIGYVVWFRPERKEVLARIDALGLQERVITMEELKQEETVIAKKQRQDAKEHLAALEKESLRLRFYIKPLLWCSVGIVLVVFLLLLPFPKPVVDEQAEKNALEIQLIDELVTSLRLIIDASEVAAENKTKLHEIIDALAVSFLPEDTTLTRTAKIATASKRLDMFASSERTEITLKKQQSETAEEELRELEKEQKLLESTIKEMQDAMGTSINVLNQAEGNFWTPVGPSAGTSYDVEPLPPEEEPVISDELLDALDPLEGGMTSNSEEQQEGVNVTANGGEELIYDPERGEIGYGVVFEEYYQEILKALTEQDLSEELRKIIEDYANSLE